MELTAADIAMLLPKRDENAHKGNFGRILLLCGSLGYTGAVNRERWIYCHHPMIEGAPVEPVTLGGNRQTFPYFVIDLSFKMIDRASRTVALYVNRRLARIGRIPLV